MFQILKAKEWNDGILGKTGILEYGILGFQMHDSSLPSFHHSNFPAFQLSMLSFRLPLVNITPAPVLARFEGLDDGVASCVKMLSGVPIR
jgi:hypothetical protein